MIVKPLGLIATLVLGVFAGSAAVGAQTGAKVHRVGFLGGASASGYVRNVEALRQGLRELGYVEGQNLVIEYRWADGQYDRLPGLTAELLRLNVALIVTQGTPAARAAKQATTRVPIVMAIVGDAVASGLVASLPRPGGNVTGSTFFFPDIVAKRLELLKEAVPRVRRPAVLINPDNPAMGPMLSALDVTARALKLPLQRITVRGPDELVGAFLAMVRERADGLVVPEDGMLFANVERIAALATTTRLPAIGFKEYAQAGGLMAYGVDFPDVWRRGAVFVDKILRGASPATLPVEQATRFELIVNRRAARALGLTMPESIRARMDQLIE